MVDDDIEHLISETFFCNHEVKHGDFDTDLRRVMGLGELSGDEEFELF